MLIRFLSKSGAKVHNLYEMSDHKLLVARYILLIKEFVGTPHYVLVGVEMQCYLPLT